jgi:hypothetical protein
MRLPFDAIDRGANMLFLEVATGAILAALCMRTPILLMIGGCFVGWSALVRLGLSIWLALGREGMIVLVLLAIGAILALLASDGIKSGAFHKDDE